MKLYKLSYRDKNDNELKSEIIAEENIKAAKKWAKLISQTSNMEDLKKIVVTKINN